MQCSRTRPSRTKWKRERRATRRTASTFGYFFSSTKVDYRLTDCGSGGLRASNHALVPVPVLPRSSFPSKCCQPNGRFTNGQRLLRVIPQNGRQHQGQRVPRSRIVNINNNNNNNNLKRLEKESRQEAAIFDSIESGRDGSRQRATRFTAPPSSFSR